MQRILSFKSLKAHTVQNRFTIIVVLIILILALSLVNFWFSLRIMSGIRAYVGGEGLWSKAQKEATNSLLRYNTSHNEADYEAYVSYLHVPLGDKQARLELNKPQPNYTVVHQGFIQGGNSAGDMNDMVLLYRYFRRVSYMSTAITTWAQGDEEIRALQQAGVQMHAIILSPTESASVKQARMTALVAQVYAIDDRATRLENHFSATLGSGSRSVASALLRITIATSCLLGVLTIAIAVLIGRALVHLDQLKSEFVSLAAHQLRTPLTAVNWYAESLVTESTSELSDKQKMYINELYKSGRRMSNLITDLLSVSSLDLGTYRSKISPVDVEALLKMVVKDQMRRVKERNISLTTHVDIGLEHVLLDEHLLMGIIQNLLSNSVKYTPKDGHVAIAVRRQSGHLLVHVSDSGIGIPAAQQSQIFSKLFRADNAKRFDTDGTGLGLYIVHAMVTYMGGRVWFRSREGKGSDFFARVPLP